MSLCGHPANFPFFAGGGGDIFIAYLILSTVEVEWVSIYVIHSDRIKVVRILTGIFRNSSLLRGVLSLVSVADTHMSQHVRLSSAEKYLIR